MTTERELIRRVRLTPYLPGKGPRFALTMWDTGLPDRRDNGRSRIAYRLTMREGKQRLQLLFEGDDFCSSPLDADDSEECVAALMGFLTLRPGDTDEEYFKNYTPAQIDFCKQHAEALGWACVRRFGEG